MLPINIDVEQINDNSISNKQTKYKTKLSRESLENNYTHIICYQSIININLTTILLLVMYEVTISKGNVETY